jgi:RNA polymerase sigma factor (sigma-70 family)
MPGARAAARDGTPRGRARAAAGGAGNFGRILDKEMTPTVAVHPEFLERLRRREPEALAEAVREHARGLFRAARSVGLAVPEAEDLVQDVFTTFLERLDGFEGRSAIRTWLFGILHRKVLERRRAAANDERTDPVDGVFESRFDEKGNWSRPPADLERLLLSKELGQLIEGCMEGLPANQREAFVLREMEGFETGEICKILEVSVTHLGVLIHRARARLRECLESKGWSRR